MRVIVITQGISNILESILESGHEVVGIVESSPSHEPNSLLKTSGRFLTSLYYSFTQNPLNLRLFSKKIGVPYYYFKKGDHEGLEVWVKSLDPDLIFVYSMSHLLKENVFSIPKFGTVNLHYSYLPEYRGPAPLFWEYHDYVLNPGVTLHYIDKGEDTGDIIYRRRVLINSGEKVEEVNQKLSFMGSKLISKMMENLEAGNVPRMKQPFSIPTIRARKIKPEEYYGLIRWDEWDTERVFHFLSGSSKYYSSLLNKNRLYKLMFSIKIMDWEKCNTSGYKIGAFYRENSKYFFACKDGKIHIDISPSAENLVKWLYPLFS